MHKVFALRPQLRAVFHARGRLLSGCGGRREIRAAGWPAARWSTGTAILPRLRRVSLRPIRGVLTRAIPLSRSSRERDLARARELGLEAYTAELDAKLDALEELLRGYNDSRHKTLFHTAAYLLPPEDLNAVLAELHGRAELDSAAAKERAAAASELLEQAAARRGLSLKLRKPKKG